MCAGLQTPPPDRARSTDAATVREAAFAAERTERERIAADLHDRPIQQIAAAQWQLEALAHELDDALGARVLDAVARLSTAQDHLRDVVFALDPPALRREGLAVAVADLLDATTAPIGVAQTLDTSALHAPSPLVASLVLRIARDGLLDAGRTPDITALAVGLRDADDGVLLAIDLTVDTPPAPPASREDPAAAALARAAGGWWRRTTTSCAVRIECWLPHR